MPLAPTRSVPSATTTPVTTLGVTDPAAIATFLKGVPLDDAFWLRVRYQCAQCGQWDTTASGALWRVSLTDDSSELYYLHARHLSAYKALHGLQSVEGRRPLRRPGAATPVVSSPRRRQGVLSGQDARDSRDSRDSCDARPPVAEEASATGGGAWRTQTVVDPVDGPLTTLYRPDGRPAAYAAGADDAALLRVAARLNSRAPEVPA